MSYRLRELAWLVLVALLLAGPEELNAAQLACAVTALILWCTRPDPELGPPRFAYDDDDDGYPY